MKPKWRLKALRQSTPRSGYVEGLHIVTDIEAPTAADALVIFATNWSTYYMGRVHIEWVPPETPVPHVGQDSPPNPRDDNS